MVKYETKISNSLIAFCFSDRYFSIITQESILQMPPGKRELSLNISRSLSVTPDIQINHSAILPSGHHWSGDLSRMNESVIHGGFFHDDVIKWKHFPRYWPFVWINGWVNKREAGDLRRYRAHYDVTVLTSIYHLCKFLIVPSKPKIDFMKPLILLKPIAYACKCLKAEIISHQHSQDNVFRACI